MNKHIFSDIIAAFVLGILNIAFSISLAAFIFSGDTGISNIKACVGLILISIVLTNLLIPLKSSFSGIVSAPQSAVVAVVGLMSSRIILNLNRSGLHEQVFPTVLAGIMFSTVLTGIILYILGRIRAGDMIRFVPHPVIGGQLAGAGLLLLLGAVPVLTGVRFHIARISDLTSSGNLNILWCGIASGIIFYVVSRKMNHFAALPGVILGCIGLFYAALHVLGIPLAEAKANGWLITGLTKGPLWKPSIISFAGVNWNVLRDQTGYILVVVFISAITLLVKAAAIETECEKEIDYDRDLRVTGIANLFAGLFGGVISFHSTSGTVLSHKMGAKSRRVGVFFALICALAIFAGTSMVSFLPRPVMGGILIYLGITFIVEWVYDAAFKLSRADYALVLVILFIVASAGFIKGVIFGVAAAAIIFVIKYSHISVIKYSFSGLHYRSKVQRPVEHEEILKKKGERIHILILQGFIFYGTADKLYADIKKMVEDDTREQRYIILDFSYVDNIDVSAINSFMKIRRLSGEKFLMLVFCGMNNKVIGELKKASYFPGPSATCLDLPDLDHGMETCENMLLANEDPDDIQTLSLGGKLDRIFDNREWSAIFMKHLEERVFPREHIIFEQGDVSDGMYFIKSGRVSAVTEIPGRGTVRFATFIEGTILGEMGVYSGMKRSARTVANEESTLYFFSAKSYQELNRETPEMINSLNRYIARILSDRLRRANMELEEILSR